MTAETRPPLTDDPARERATTDFTTNLVVRAGAGTGKTSLLVERLLNALGRGVVSMTRLAAITFTEKAAGELRQRLARGLDRLRGLAAGELTPDAVPSGEEARRAFDRLSGVEGVAPATIAARCLAAMEQLDRATVSTIHGFCSELLHAHPLEAGVDPGFAVDSGEHAETLRRELWQQFVARELGPGAPRAELWERLLGRTSLAALGALAHAMADFGLPAELLREPGGGRDDQTLFGTEASACVAALESVLARQSGLTELRLRLLRETRETLDAFAVDGSAGLRAVLRARPDLARRLADGSAYPGANKKLTGVDPAELDAAASRAWKLVKRLAPLDEELTAAAARAVAPFALEFREALLRRGLVSFDGLLALTRDLLRDHPDVRDQVKRRFHMLLVDEFQDTDPLQYEIVLLLSEVEADNASDPWAARLVPGKLFVVGDDKQSIYRFRGADHVAFERAVERIVGAGGAALYLVSNFRGVGPVLEPVNRLFEARDGLWQASDVQTEYVPIQAARVVEATEPRVELWTVDLPPDTRADDRREAEGRILARTIDRLVREERSCSFRQITIQLRAFTRLNLYLRPLRERAIPFVVDGGRDFHERPEVGQLIATLRALARPADQPALLAFLRSPAGGVSDEALAAYALDGGRFNWRAPVDARRHPRIAGRFAFLCSLAEETAHLPTDALVRRVVDRALLLPLGAAAFEGAQRVANLRRLAATAAEMGRDGRLSFDDIVAALREGRIADLQTDPPLADDAADAVLITNIHKMKGLENEVVFVPDLARGEYRPAPTDPVRVTRFKDGSAALALRVDGTCNGARIAFEQEHERHERAEETRVLYVALTRARERLVLLVGPSKKPSPWVGALAAWGYDPSRAPADGAALCDGAVIHRLVRPGPRVARADATAEEGAGPSVTRYEAALRRAQDVAPPFARPSDEADESDVAVRRPGQTDLFAWAEIPRPRARAVGVALHRLLQTWDGEDAERLRARLQPVCAEAARATGATPGPVLALTRELLESFLASPLGARFASVDKVARELPLLLRRDDGRAFRGSIDLLYRDDDGNLVVADYKTDVETDATRLRERYGEQVRVYARAARVALGLAEAPRAELWSLRTGERIAVETG